VFEVRGQAFVPGADGPFVGLQPDAPAAQGNDRFDGDDHAVGQLGVGAGLVVIGHAGFLVDAFAHAVAAQFPDDVKTQPLDLFFHGPADVPGAVADARGGKTLVEGLFGTTGQGLGFGRHRAQTHGHGRVGHIPVLFRRDVAFDEIAFLQAPITRNAVHRFFVDADAGRAREVVDLGRGGFGPVGGQGRGAHRVQFGRGHAGAGRLGHGVEAEADDFADGPQFFQIEVRLYRHRDLPYPPGVACALRGLGEALPVEGAQVDRLGQVFHAKGRFAVEIGDGAGDA